MASYGKEQTKTLSHTYAHMNGIKRKIRQKTEWRMKSNIKFVIAKWCGERLIVLWALHISRRRGGREKWSYPIYFTRYFTAVSTNKNANWSWKLNSTLARPTTSDRGKFDSIFVDWKLNHRDLTACSHPSRCFFILPSFYTCFFGFIFIFWPFFIILPWCE